MDAEYADAVARIHDTIGAYAQAVDDARVDDVVATFLPDGWVSIPGGEVQRGHDAIRKAYAAMPTGARQRHMVVNTVVSDYDGQSAAVSSDLIFFAAGESGWKVRLVGRYSDRLQASGGRWLFESRELVFV